MENDESGTVKVFSSGNSQAYNYTKRLLKYKSRVDICRKENSKCHLCCISAEHTLSKKGNIMAINWVCAPSTEKIVVKHCVL